jgi:hypothetical protein
MALELTITEPMVQYPAISGVPGAFDTAWNSLGDNTPFSIVTGIDGTGKALRSTRSNGFISSGWVRAFKTPDSKLTMHFAFMLPFMGPNPDFLTAPWSEILDNAGLRQFGLGFNALGKMIVIGEGGLVVATSGAGFITNQAYRCCLQVDMSAANATVFKMSVNETGNFADGFDVTIDAQDQATQIMAGIRIPYIYSSPGSSQQSYDIILQDIIVGTGDCQDWGPMEVLLGPPTADIAVAWTRSAGASNFGNVDELPFTGDADYNSSSTIGQQDIFDYQDPPHVPEFILSLSQLTIARKEDSATREIANILKLAGGIHTGPNLPLMETYSQIWTHWLLNPETAAQFTPAEYNAAQGGYEYRV